MCALHRQLPGRSLPPVLSRVYMDVVNLPSVVVTDILSHLNWGDKLNAVSAVLPWRPHLKTPVAWPLVLYEHESEENIYFTKERRTNLLICLKLYGKYIRKIKLSFGYKVGRSGVQILHAIAENCSSLQLLSLTQEPVDTALSDSMWKRSVVQAVCLILVKCTALSSFGIYSPVIDWSDPQEDNVVLGIVQSGMMNKVTELFLTTNSLLEHERHLNLLTGFSRLQKLMVRREKVNDEILLTLVRNNLQEVTLYQDEELTLDESRQLGNSFWGQVMSLCPNFKVDLVLKYIMVIRDSFPVGMPLRCLILDDLANIVTKGVMDHLVLNYHKTLESFTYTNSFLENFESGDKRLPAALVSMVKQCTKLEKIHYGFPLSSTTILLLVKAKNLKHLVIPSVEVFYDFDWPMQEDWSPDYVEWLKESGSSEQKLESTVSELLGFQWQLSYDTGLDRSGYL